MFGQAFLLFALYYLGRGLVERRRIFLLLGAGFAALSVGTWIPSAAFLAITIPLFAAFTGSRYQLPLRKLAGALAGWGVLVVGLSLVFLPFYLGSVEILQSRTLNPYQYGWSDLDRAFETIFREWPDAVVSPPLVLSLVGFLTLYCVSVRRHGSLLAPAAASMMLSSLALFFASFEIRFLSLLAIGIMAALAFLLSDLFVMLKGVTVNVAVARAARLGVVAVALFLMAFQVGASHQESKAIFNYYRVLDEDVVDGLDWLRENVPRDSVIVASGNVWGFHYGWWIEGYSKIPTFNATDALWFSFQEEKEQNDIARALLASTSRAEAATLAELYRIGYIFLDKRVLKAPSILAGTGFTPVFENAAVQILRYVSVRDGNSVSSNP